MKFTARAQIRKISVVFATATAFCLLAGPAQAATTVYPAGGSSFSGSAQGWQTTSATCDVPVLCTASGGYDGADGNPAGSIDANTSITLNLLTLFDSNVVEQSPDFTVSSGGSSTLHVDRAFAPGDLVDLAPQAKYSVALIDTTAGTQSVALEETLTGATPFSGKDAAVAVKAGHTYAIEISTETTSTVVGTGLLAGTTSARFDNVSLSVQGEGGGEGNGSGSGGKGGNGGNGGSGDGTLSQARLLSLFQSGQSGTATQKGNRLFVKVACPKQVSGSCRITAQGLLKKHKPATAKRTVKVRSGKGKQIALRVMPSAMAQVAKRKKLLVSEKVRAGKLSATAYKSRKLIRRG
jgi:hypothetical protein